MCVCVCFFFVCFEIQVFFSFSFLFFSFFFLFICVCDFLISKALAGKLLCIEPIGAESLRLVLRDTASLVLVASIKLRRSRTPH